MAIRIGVKYCGGCNPTYDRVALVKTIKENLSGLIEVAGADNGVDLVLAVHGCVTACADLSDFQGLQVFSITDADQAESFLKWIKQNYL